MMIDPVEMGKRLQAVRLYYGESVEDVATTLGVTVDTVKRWEAGGSTMRTEKLRDFCLTYHVSSDFILGKDVEEASESSNV